MLIEIARPIALLLCMLSLCALFYTLFFEPPIAASEISWTSVILLSLTAGICLLSGFIFLDPEEWGAGALVRTLPVQLFLWAAGMMVVFLVSARYLETDGIFYKDVRRL